MAKKKVKKENTDLEKLKVLEDKLKEIYSRWHAMTEHEQKIIGEAKEEINEIKNLINLKNK